MRLVKVSSTRCLPVRDWRGPGVKGVTLDPPHPKDQGIRDLRPSRIGLGCSHVTRVSSRKTSDRRSTATTWNLRVRNAEFGLPTILTVDLFPLAIRAERFLGKYRGNVRKFTQTYNICTDSVTPRGVGSEEDAIDRRPY